MATFVLSRLLRSLSLSHQLFVTEHTQNAEFCFLMAQRRSDLFILFCFFFAFGLVHATRPCSCRHLSSVPPHLPICV